MPSKEQYRNDAKRAALAQSLASIGSISADPGLQRMAQANSGTASNLSQAAAQGMAEEEAKKKKKAASLGKIGSLAAGLIAAPFTAGMSLPAAMAVGGLASAAGGSLGEMAGGGSPSLGNALSYGASGAIGSGIGRGLSAVGKTATAAQGATAEETGAVAPGTVGSLDAANGALRSLRDQSGELQ